MRCRYLAQHDAHEQLLAGFQQDYAVLQGIPLHPVLQVCLGWVGVTRGAEGAEGWVV